MAKVKIQGHASGTGILTVTAPNTSTDRVITLPDSSGTLVDNTTAVTKDASGNVGIGVTPETDIPSLYKALQINGAGSIYAKESGTDCRLHLSSNASMNSSYDDKYIKSSVNSSTYIQSAGTHTFQTAASGSADGTISWTTGFEVLNDGKARAKNGLLFGTDTAAANALDDYEEGTFTPVFKDTSNVTVTGSVYNASYTKIGQMVFISVYYSPSNVQNGYISNMSLPFTASGNQHRSAGSLWTYNGPIAEKSNQWLVQTNTSHASFWKLRDNLTSTTMQWDNGTEIVLSIAYFTSQ